MNFTKVHIYTMLLIVAAMIINIPKTKNDITSLLPYMLIPFTSNNLWFSAGLVLLTQLLANSTKIEKTAVFILFISSLLEVYIAIENINIVIVICTLILIKLNLLKMPPTRNRTTQAGILLGVTILLYKNIEWMQVYNLQKLFLILLAGVFLVTAWSSLELIVITGLGLGFIESNQVNLSYIAFGIIMFINYISKSSNSIKKLLPYQEYVKKIFLIALTVFLIEISRDLKSYSLFYSPYLLLSIFTYFMLVAKVQVSKTVGRIQLFNTLVLVIALISRATI